MVETRKRIQEYRSLWLLLILVAGLTAAVISSCGGGGGSSDGDLCQQCGSTDGPCQPTIQVAPGPGEPPPCNCTPDNQGAPGPGQPPSCSTLPNPCSVDLICRRKSDSAQQRCYPKDPNTNDVNFQWVCNGSRPGGTAVPKPTPTLTPSPAPTVVQVCGNDIIEGTEECDGTNLGGETCLSLGCQFPGGILSCLNCVFIFDLCTGGADSCP